MTITRRRCTLASLWTVTILALCVWGQSESFAQSDTVAAPSSDETASTTTVNPDDLVRGMASLLSSAQSFTLHIEKSFDVVLTDGAKVQYSGAADIAIRRPDKIYVVYGDDVSAKELWYDGSRPCQTKSA